MEGFTIIDGVVALVIVLSALLGYGRGLVREIPVVGEFLADSCELSIIGAFALVFAVALILVSLFTPLFSSLVQRSVLGGLDQGLGFLFGVARGILLVAIAFFVYQVVIPDQQYTIVDDSRSATVFARFTGEIQEQNPEAALGWITTRYEELVGPCGA